MVGTMVSLGVEVQDQLSTVLHVGYEELSKVFRNIFWLLSFLDEHFLDFAIEPFCHGTTFAPIQTNIRKRSKPFLTDISAM